MITTVQCSICSQLNNKPRVVVTYFKLHHICSIITSEGVFYIDGHGCVLYQFIEPVTFARCAFIFALCNIALGGYLDTRINI